MQDAVGSALATLGDGNWRMGDGMRMAANKGPKSTEQLTERILLEHYICASLPSVSLPCRGAALTAALTRDSKKTITSKDDLPGGESADEDSEGPAVTTQSLARAGSLFDHLSRWIGD